MQSIIFPPKYHSFFMRSVRINGQHTFKMQTEAVWDQNWESGHGSSIISRILLTWRFSNSQKSTQVRKCTVVDCLGEFSSVWGIKNSHSSLRIATHLKAIVYLVGISNTRKCLQFFATNSNDQSLCTYWFYANMWKLFETALSSQNTRIN